MVEENIERERERWTKGCGGVWGDCGANWPNVVHEYEEHTFYLSTNNNKIHSMIDRFNTNQ